MRISKDKRLLTCIHHPQKEFQSIIQLKQSKKYSCKMEHFLKNSKQSTKHSINSISMAKNISITPQNIKQQYDAFVHKLFNKIDFDFSGFITSNKITYNKELSDQVFYFFGGIFQKIKQLGGVSEKVFVSLCSQIFIHAKNEDLEAILNSENTNIIKSKQLKPLNKTKKLIRCSTQSKYSSKNKSKQHNNQLTQKQSNIQSSLKHQLSSKYSLRIQFQKLQNKNSRLNELRIKKKQQLQKLGLSCPRVPHENRSYQSMKVQQLTERLDRQLQHCTNRLTQINSSRLMR